MRIPVRFCAALMAACFCGASAMANDMTYQTSAVTEEGLPVFYPELKQQLTYPGSWLSGNVKDFAVWKTEARQKLRTMLLTPDSHRDFAPATIER